MEVKIRAAHIYPIRTKSFLLTSGCRTLPVKQADVKPYVPENTIFEIIQKHASVLTDCYKLNKNAGVKIFH